VIVATSTAGTTFSDYMDRTLGLGYFTGALILLAALGAVLGIWRALEGSLSVGAIRTRRGEALYWLAILVSNTLGTALGDFLADDSGLGFLGGWLVICAALAVVLGLYLFTRRAPTALFWTAFILTRPFGATFGDVLTKPVTEGGFDLGRGAASLVLLCILIVTGVGWDRRRQARI
jgi:uncharacterized membrane-anchored protein